MKRQSFFQSLLSLMFYGQPSSAYSRQLPTQPPNPLAACPIPEEANMIDRKGGRNGKDYASKQVRQETLWGTGQDGTLQGHSNICERTGRISSGRVRRKNSRVTFAGPL